MRFCELKSDNQNGSVPLLVTCVLTAVVAAAAFVPGSLLPGFGAAVMLPLFAGGMTFGGLRANFPRRFRPSWALVGFPLMIGVTILSVSVLGESSPPSKGSTGGAIFWMLPCLFLGRAFRKTDCTTNCGVMRYVLMGFGALLCIPAAIAGWLVWDAVQSGQGRLYAALPNLLQAAGIWTGTMFLVGVAMVATMGMRQRPQHDDALAELAASN